VERGDFPRRDDIERQAPRGSVNLAFQLEEPADEPENRIDELQPDPVLRSSGFKVAPERQRSPHGGQQGADVRRVQLELLRMAVHELDVLDELVLIVVNERDDPCAGLLVEVMQHVHDERYRDNIRRIERTGPAFQDPLRMHDAPRQRVPEELHCARGVNLIFFERLQALQRSFHHLGKSGGVIVLERFPPPHEVVLPEELDQLQRKGKPRRRRPVLHQAHCVVRAAVEHRVGKLRPGEMKLVDLREEELCARLPEQVAEPVPDLVDARESQCVPVQFLLPDDRQAFRYHWRGDFLEVGRRDKAFRSRIRAGLHRRDDSRNSRFRPCTRCNPRRRSPACGGAASSWRSARCRGTSCIFCPTRTDRGHRLETSCSWPESTILAFCPRIALSGGAVR
jgi:hypothetical protein